MNLLGHIYFSGNDLQLAVANLFGDFTKGKQYLEYPEYIQRGVLLHREIDFFIDNHPKVKELVQLIRPELPRIAPVAIDLFFDHLLAGNWKQFHPVPLDRFLDQFYEESPQYLTDFPPSFVQFMQALNHRKWISSYREKEGLERMCRGVGSRLSFENALPSAPYVFSRYRDEITRVFHEYMRDADEHFLTRNSKLIT